MLKIQKLVRPNKRSGYPLKPGDSTLVRGLTVTNDTTSVIYIDKWTRKKAKKRKNKKKKK